MWSPGGAPLGRPGPRPATGGHLQQIALTGPIPGWPRATPVGIITLSDRGDQGERSPSRLIETEVDVAAFAVAFRGPMGWLPNRLPTALARSGFRSRCRPVGSRRGVARKTSQVLRCQAADFAAAGCCGQAVASS